MKKILLSSIIMLGVCGAVNAQNATASKFKKNDAAASTNTSAPALTPQKAANVVSSDDRAPVAETPKTAADKEAAAVAPTTRIKNKPAQAKTSSSVNAAGVNAEGVFVGTDEERAAKAKAAGEKKNQQ